MNDVAQKTGVANSEVERQIAGFRTTTAQSLNDLTQLATQFDAHGRSLAEAVALIDRSNRAHRGRAHRAAPRARGAGDHARQQGQRPRAAAHALLQPARPVARRRGRAGARDRPPDRRVDHRRRARDRREFRDDPHQPEEERKRATEAMRTIYEQATGGLAVDAHAGGGALRRRGRGAQADDRRDAARARSDPRRAAQAAFSNCRRRPPRAPPRCAASSSTRSRRWPSSTASSPGTAAASMRSSPRRAARRGGRGPGARRVMPKSRRSPMAAPRPEPPRPPRADITGMTRRRCRPRRADARR